MENTTAANGSIIFIQLSKEERDNLPPSERKEYLRLAKCQRRKVAKARLTPEERKFELQKRAAQARKTYLCNAGNPEKKRAKVPFVPLHQLSVCKQEKRRARFLIDEATRKRKRMADADLDACQTLAQLRLAEGTAKTRVEEALSAASTREEELLSSPKKIDSQSKRVYSLQHLVNCHEVAASHNVYGVHDNMMATTESDRKEEDNGLEADPIECWSNSGDRKEKDDVDSILVELSSSNSKRTGRSSHSAIEYSDDDDHPSRPLLGSSESTGYEIAGPKPTPANKAPRDKRNKSNPASSSEADTEYRKSKPASSSDGSADTKYLLTPQLNKKAFYQGSRGGKIYDLTKSPNGEVEAPVDFDCLRALSLPVKTPPRAAAGVSPDCVDAHWLQELQSVKDHLNDRKHKEYHKALPMEPFTQLADMLRVGTGLSDPGSKYETCFRESYEDYMPSLLHIARLVDPTVGTVKANPQVETKTNRLTYDQLTLQVSDAIKARPTVWFGDGLVDGYCEYLNRVSARLGGHSFFVSSIKSQWLLNGSEAPDRLLYASTAHGKSGLTLSQLCDDFERVVIPVNVVLGNRLGSRGNHWCLAVLSREPDKKETIRYSYYDSLFDKVCKSLPPTRKSSKDAVYNKVCKALSGKTCGLPEYTDSPQQGIDDDCGVFVCLNMEATLVAPAVGEIARLPVHDKVDAYRLLVLYRCLCCVVR